MNNLQITINACLAITVAVLIYQNQQIKNQLDTFKRDIEVINSPYREAIPLSMITGAYFECQADNGKKLTFLTYPEADISIYRSTGRIEFRVDDGDTQTEIYEAKPISRVLESNSIYFDYAKNTLLLGRLSNDEFSCRKL